MSQESVCPPHSQDNVGSYRMTASKDLDNCEELIYKLYWKNVSLYIIKNVFAETVILL